MYPYFDKKFSKNQWGFRKGLNTQHILLAMIEKIKTLLYVNNSVHLF